MAMPKRMAFTKYVVSRYKVVSSIAFNPFSYDFLLSPRVENVEKILNSSLHKENNLWLYIRNKPIDSNRINRKGQ